MKRSNVSSLGSIALAIALMGIPVARLPAVAQGPSEPYCEIHVGVCPDTSSHRNYEGAYVGHDEPSVNFYSSRPGSGNSNTWQLRLPTDASVLPRQDGTGGTWNFQQHTAFWFGMAVCETQSYPNPGLPCRANSDANIKDDSIQSSPNWIGNHVGTGFLELQFYPPGWVPEPIMSCDATKWCAAMAVFGLSENQTQFNNSACLNSAGLEWVDFAFLTLNGRPQAPPDPLRATAATYTADSARDLFMNPGDELAISIHDSSDGLVTRVIDTTTEQSGSMTASVANGFAHPLFQPNALACTEEPYAFHPMYSTSSEHTRVPWTAHSWNVAFSDEIGHFEYCKHANADSTCASPGVNDKKIDADDIDCFNATDSLLVRIGGCLGSDVDFDGTSYLRDWPGTLADANRDRQLHGESFQFTSPRSDGQNYERVALEADLPPIEYYVGCDIFTGSGCVNPPPGANFYPIYSIAGRDACAWQEGGTHIPGTTNTFGGTSTSEYGPILLLNFPPDPFFAAVYGISGPVNVYEDYRNVLSGNPCRSNGRLPEPVDHRSPPQV